MNTYKFDLNSIEELYSYGLFDTVDSIFQFMKKQVKNENLIILENRSHDMETNAIKLFHDTDELNQFYNSFMDNHKIPFNVLCDLPK